MLGSNHLSSSNKEVLKLILKILSVESSLLTELILTEEIAASSTLKRSVSTVMIQISQEDLPLIQSSNSVSRRIPGLNLISELGTSLPRMGILISIG